MQADKISEQRLFEKNYQLVSEQIVLVENFIDFLYHQNADVSLIAATKLSEPALQKIWDNP